MSDEEFTAVRSLFSLALVFHPKTDAEVLKLACDLAAKTGTITLRAIRDQLTDTIGRTSNPESIRDGCVYTAVVRELAVRLAPPTSCS